MKFPHNVVLFIVFAICSVTLHAQDGKLTLPCGDCNTEQLKVRMQYVATMHSAWFLPPMIPGATLEVREQSRSKNADGTTAIEYHFIAKGFPAKAKFRLQYWPVGQEMKTIADGITLDADGLLLCDGPGGCGKHSTNPMNVNVQAARGEAKRFVLISDNGKWRALGMAIPFPEVSEDNGCKLNMTLVAANGTEMFIWATGFPPNTEIQLLGNSAGEILQSIRHTNAEGQFAAVELPGVIGKNDGIDTVSVVGGVSCRPSVSLPWAVGDENTYHPL